MKMPMSDPNPSDTDLLRRFAARSDQAAFAELVERTVGLVYAAALRQLGGSVHRAQEVTQLVFIDLARKAGALARRDDLAGWLYTSTHYAAAKLKRGEQRREAREAEAHMMQETLAGGADEADWERLRPVLDDAMLALSEADRAALLQRFFQGRRFAEIGRTQATSEDAARMRVERALDKLRLLLGQRGITSTGAALAAALAHPAVAAAPAGLAATVTGAALAGGASSAAAGVLFMQTTKWVAGGVFVAALGVAVVQFNHARQSDAQLAALIAERDRLDAQLKAERQRVTTVIQKGESLQQELASARNPKPGAPSGRYVYGGNAATVTAGALTISGDAAGTFTLKATPTDPVAREKMMRASAAENTNSTYAALYRLAGWTEAQQQQFRDLMYDRLRAEQALYSAAVADAKAKNPKFDRADQYEIFEAMRATAEREDQAAVRSAMGDAAAQALDRYQSTLPMRFAVRELANSLFSSGTPIEQAQAERLIDVMAANARGFDGRVDILALNVDAAAAQAQGLLNDAQLAELRQVVGRAQERRKQERERNMAPAGTLTIKSSDGKL